MEISMIIFQKTLSLMLFIKDDKPRLKSVYNYRPASIYIWNEHKEYKQKNVRNEKNTYKEHWQYNKKAWNLKNVDFDRGQFFDPRHTFMNPCDLQKNLTDSCSFHAIHKPTYPRNLHYLVRRLLLQKVFLFWQSSSYLSFILKRVFPVGFLIVV